MKAITTIVLFFSFLLNGLHLLAQGDNNSSTISLAVAMPNEIKGLTEEQIAMLQDRIKNIVSMNGLSAEGGADGFVIYPTFNINSIQQATSTIKTVTIAKCNLSLFVRQFIPNSTSNIVFSSLYMDVTGSGFSSDEAISSAIAQVRPSDEAFQTFLSKAKTRIIDYYVQNCEKILNEAINAANLENYDKAFALLLSIPKEAGPCYGQVQQKTMEIYLKKQRQDCGRLILKAKAFAAQYNFDSALATLRTIDPESICREDLWALMNEIGSKVDAQAKEELELVKQKMRDDVELQKSRDAAEVEMAKAYLIGAGRTTYTVNGNGANATIQSSQPNNAPNNIKTGSRPTDLPKIGLTGSSSSVDVLATTILKPVIMFENNLFPSFIIGSIGLNTPEEMKRYGDKYNCIGMSISNSSTSGTIIYEIEPVENKFFDKVSGKISFVQNQQKIFFPEIPWKFEALKTIQQSTPLSIKYRLIDKDGKTREEVVKVNMHSIQECITAFSFEGKFEQIPLLAAYVNEENPFIEKLSAEGLEKKWVSNWTGYQLGAEELDKQVKAIWKILSSKGIHYSDITGATTNVNQSFFSQTVRPFCQSIGNKQANCVDGTVLFASILKRINIRPVIVLVPGHCFLAYHRSETDANDYIYLETTILGNIKGQPTDDAFEKNYLDALAVGTKEFKAANGNFFMIDVLKAREQKVSAINLSDDGCK